MNMQLLLSKAEINPDQASVSARLLVLVHLISIAVRKIERKKESVCVCVSAMLIHPFAISKV